jgi:hypothetical protein
MGLGRWILCAASLAACGDNRAAPDANSPDASSPDASSPDARLCLAGGTYPLQIAAGAFPPDGVHPNVIVHVPPGFDPAPPLDLVVFLHGYDNCIETVIGDTDQACSAGGVARAAAALASQFDATGRNALLVVPELAFDSASANPGELGVTDGLHALLGETLAALPAPLGPLDVARHGRIIIAAYSGGYVAAALAPTLAGVPIDEIWLMDALYGYSPQFEDWMKLDLGSFAMSTRRFVDVYTASGGTDTNSRSMVADVTPLVDPSALVDDTTPGLATDAELHHGVVFKLSDLAHTAVPRTYFQLLVASSPLAATCDSQ